MGEQVRICLFETLAQVLKINVLKCNGSRCSRGRKLTWTNSPPPTYRGYFSASSNLFIRSIFGEDRLNYTLTLKHSIGIFNSTSGHYDEESCLYSMQTNQSDFTMAWTWYPVKGENLKALPLYRSEKVKMISYYTVHEQTYDMDAMGVFAYAFTPGVWLTVALLCLAFWLITKMHVRIKNRMDTSQMTRDDSLYEVLTHLFQVETIDYTGPSMKTVSLFASVLSFLVILHFTCSMKTDIVVVKDPDLVNNYDDLLTKPDIRLMFSSLDDTLSKFESAHPQSKERRAFERSLSAVGGDKRKMIIHLTDFRLHNSIQDIAFEKDRRTVVPILSSQTEAATNIICYAKIRCDHSPYDCKNFFSWTSEDPDAREDIMTSVHSAFYKSPYLEKVQRRVKWFVAMGLNTIWDRINDVQLVRHIYRVSKDSPMYRKCRAKDYRENLPQAEFAPFAPVQFKALTITSGVLLVVSVVAFAREKYKKRLKHRPRLVQNKVAVAAPGGVAKQSDRDDAPFASVAIAIEVVDQEERQDTPNVQSKVEVAPSMKLFSKRSSPQQVQLCLNTAAGPSAKALRPDQSAQSSCTNAPSRQEEATEVFLQEESQDTLSVQSRVEVAPSMKFSHKRGDQKVKCEVELAPSTSERHGDFAQRDRPVRLTRDAVLFRNNDGEGEIELFERGTPSTSNEHSAIRVVPSMDFSSSRSDLGAEMWCPIRSRHRLLRLTVTRL